MIWIQQPTHHLEEIEPACEHYPQYGSMYIYINIMLYLYLYKYILHYMYILYITHCILFICYTIYNILCFVYMYICFQPLWDLTCLLLFRSEIFTTNHQDLTVKMGRRWFILDGILCDKPGGMRTQNKYLHTQGFIHKSILLLIGFLESKLRGTYFSKYAPGKI